MVDHPVMLGYVTVTVRERIKLTTIGQSSSAADTVYTIQVIQLTLRHSSKFAVPPLFP